MSEDCNSAQTKKKAKITDGVDEGNVQEQQEKEQSLLLRVLNDDVLPLLFAQILPLEDALHLGSTCRRLYGLYLKSCTDRRSLEIYHSKYADKLRLKHTFEATAADKLTKANHCSVVLPDVDSTTAEKITTFFTQLFVRLPNLVSLEVADGSVSKWTFSPLLTALRSSPLLSGRLQALTLAIDEKMRANKKMLEPLHLPALKHLTLYLDNDEIFPIGQLFLNLSLFDAVFSQLTSFRLYAGSRSPKNVLRFVKEHFLRFADAHLATAAAAIDNSSSSLQIALRIPDFVFNFLQWAPGEYHQALACVTSLDIDQIKAEEEEEEYEEEDEDEDEDEGEGMVANLHLQMLPLLTNLKKVRISLSESKTDAKWYPRVLTALAKLPKLKTVVIKTRGKTPLWDRKLMPVLPTVRVCFLDITSTYHVNAVEAVHLAHCFPGLHQISVTFEQYNCEFCYYRLAADDDLGPFQECAMPMSCDLQRLGTGTGWQVQVKLKKLMT